MVKNLPAMREARAGSPGGEGLLEEEVSAQLQRSPAPYSLPMNVGARGGTRSPGENVKAARKGRALTYSWRQRFSKWCLEPAASASVCARGMCDESPGLQTFPWDVNKLTAALLFPTYNQRTSKPLKKKNLTL